MSAARMTPPVNFTPSTDVPVTMGLLEQRKEREVEGSGWRERLRRKERGKNNVEGGEIG